MNASRQVRQWDAAYVLRRAVSCRAPGVRGASGQSSHLPVGRLGTYCPPRVCWLADAAMLSPTIVTK
jgi:hypothetical protein